jgi:hypothetical protein
MARDLRLLPRAELGIGLAQQLDRLALELLDLGVDIDRPRVGGGAKLVNAPVEFGERLFEFKIGLHQPRGLRAQGSFVNESGTADAAR